MSRRGSDRRVRCFTSSPCDRDPHRRAARTPWWSRRTASPPARAWWSRDGTAEAMPAADMLARTPSAPPARVVIEERLVGRGVDLIVMADGTPAGAARRRRTTSGADGDEGPNTGGMGTYSPSPLVDAGVGARILRDVFVPTLRALAAPGRPFTRAALRRPHADARSRPVVIEWNCRFGDPETQSVLMRLQSRPQRSSARPLSIAGWTRVPGRSGTSAPALGVVMAARGYPDAPAHRRL